MRYFVELLESYSRLKKRKLVLLEQSVDDSQVKGDAALATVENSLNTPNPNKKNNPYIPGDATTPIKMWITDKGTVYWAEASSPADTRGFPARTDLKRFYQNFRQAGAPGEEQAQQPTDDQVGAAPQVVQPYSNWKGAEIINKLFPANKISKFIKSLFRGKELTPEEMLKEAEALRLQLKAGDHNGSWAKALFKAYKKIVHEDGTFRDYDISEEEDMLDLKLEVQDRLVRAVDLVSKEDPLTDEECIELKRSVVMLPRGRIAIKQPLEYGGRGLIFNDRSKRLNLLLNQGAKNKGCDLERKTLGELGSNTADAVRVRGDFMESLEEIVHTIKSCHIQLSDPKSKNRKQCMARAEAAIGQWKSERDKLNLYFKALEKTDSPATGEFAIPMEIAEEMEVLTRVREIFGDNAPEILVKRLTAFAIRDHRIRMPDHLIRINKETGEGKRADTIELYDTKEKAVAALIRSGFNEEEANNLVSETDVSKLCSKQEYVDQCPVDTTRPYYRVSVSLKNYLNLENGIHLGGRSADQISDFITGQDCRVRGCTQEQIQSSRRLRESMAKTLGQDWLNDVDSEQYKEMLRVHDQMEKVKSSIDNLGKKVTKTLNGKEIDIDTLKNFGETFKENLKNNKTYSEYINDDIPGLIDEYIEQGKNPEEIKARITSYIQNKMLNKQASRGGNAGMIARTYICSKKFLAGASSDNTIASVRSLERMESFNLRQNDVYSGLADYIKNGKNSKWKLNISNSTIAIRNEETGARVSTAIDIDKNGKIDYGARTNAPMLERLSKKSLIEDTNVYFDHNFNIERPSEMFLNFFNKFINFEI